MPSGILASLAVEIGAEISGFQRGVAQAKKELAGLVKAGQAMQGIGQSLSLYVSAPLVAVATLAVGASGKIESLRNGLQAITTQELAKQGTVGLEAIQQSAVSTTARLKELEIIARQPGLGFEEAVKGDVRLRAVGISSEQSAKAIKAFANAIATTGGGKNEFDRVTVQLAQLSAKGKVLAQDLRPIIEAAPAVSGALQKLYGTVDSETISESLKKQGQSSTDFIRVLTDELGKLPQVTGSLKNGLENFQDTLTLSLAKIGDGISKSLNLPAVLASLSSGVDRIADAFANLSPGAQTAIVALAGLVAATGPVLVAVGSIGVALPAITAGFATLGIGSLAALGPILPVAAALAAAAFLVVENWERVAPIFTSIGNTLSGVFDSLRGTVVEIGQRLAELGLTSEVAGKALKLLGGVLTDQLVLPLRLLAGALDVAVGGLRVYVAVMSGDFKAATAGGAQVLDGLKFGLLGIQKETVSTAADFRAFFKDVIEGSKEVVEGLAGGDIAAALGQSNGLLAELESRLKSLKDAKPDLTSEADILGINQQIAAVEKEIKRLNELGIASKGAETALSKLRTELRVNGEQSTLLGAQYDFIGERQKILAKGVEDLLEKGYKRGSAAVQGFAAQLRQLNTDLGDNTRLANSAIDGLAKLKVLSDDKKRVNPLDGTEIKDFALPNALPAPDFTPLQTAATAQQAAYEQMTGTQREAYRTMLSAQEEFNTNTQALIDDFPLEAFSAIGAGIGSALATGGNVLEGAGRALLKVLADFGTAYGKQLILFGIADIATGLFVPKGLAEIAAGTALVAGSAVVGALGGGGSAVPSSGVSASPINAGTAARVPEQRIKIELEPVTFRQKGPDLDAVASVNKYRQLRLS